MKKGHFNKYLTNQPHSAVKACAIISWSQEHKTGQKWIEDEKNHRSKNLICRTAAFTGNKEINEKLYYIALP